MPHDHPPKSAPHGHQHGAHDHQHGDHHGHAHGHDRGHGHKHDHGDHSHDHGGPGHSHDRPQGSERQLLIAFILTAGFMFAEVIGGLISGSLALIADAGHMLTDAASLALALFALRISRRPSDQRRSYGYGRMQVLAAFVNGISLVALVTWIAVEAALRLFKPVPVLAGPMLAIAVLGLLVNLAAFWILHRGERGNLNVDGAMAHVLGDLLGSAAAIVAALVIMATGWTPVDPLLSVLVAGLILRTALRITRESGHILLQGAPTELDPTQLEREVRAAVPGVAGVHHVHLWSLTPDERIITLHAVLGPDADGDQVTAAIANFLRSSRGIGHVTVQIERQPCAEPEHRCAG
ncbi:cation diffusion facilitator family transporter [Solimonas sp. K1W22B-7]|uniref:cation diffusion facilitator family transporter n=1 Tax=Solimonas sp. K1W22B-7 TaxID=2303331 RepID=UPI000E335D7D|nr:cation diffusion facilitator family transporter [Solimonas sp. K1W22B-7]AXQ29843.1 cation diffusion facilitator family transporter [Solimonas sp. K1W22B-7]